MSQLRFAFSSLCAAVSVCAAEIVVTVDVAKTNRSIRPLHGVNRGPLVAGGIVDLTAQHRELAIPFTRLHDSHWPSSDVVDIHAVFPNPHADPSHPDSYQFALTDEYIAAVRATGAQVVYRLGESIEHTRIKRFVQPPEDPRRWANVCVGIIRHYNEGWANGTRANIHYWEIWNEPENRPVMWTGTDEQFLELYRTASRAIRAHDPTLKIGGSGFGHSGRFVNGRFEPSAFVSNFLARCRSEALPLDFFSWHCYTASPAELVARARAIRSVLDSFGFPKTESHLNEWNYLESWESLSSTATPEAREKAYREIAGPKGAAFIAASLIQLQDAPVDMCNLFHAETGGFGLFSAQGVPHKNFHALRAFRELLRTPERVAVAINSINAVALAGRNQSDAQVLVAGSVDEPTTVQLSFAHSDSPAGWTARIIDAQRSFEAITNIANRGELRLPVSGPFVMLVSGALSRTVD